MAASSTLDSHLQTQRNPGASQIPGQSTLQNKIKNSDRLHGSHLPYGPTTRVAADSPNASSTVKRNSKDDVTTPTKSLLSSNITPRSGSRKARVDSASTTPNGTPNQIYPRSRPTSIVYTGDQCAQISQGLGNNEAKTRARGRTSRSGSVASKCDSSNVSLKRSSPTHGKSNTSPARTPMFFHVNAVRHSSPQSSPTEGPVASPTSMNVIKGNSVRKAASLVDYTLPSDSVGPKFFHADDLAATKPPSDSASAGITPITSHIVSPRQTTFSQSHRSVPQRSSSPLKEFEISRKDLATNAGSGARVPSLSGNAQSSEQSPTGPPPQLQASPRRKISLKVATIPSARHTKSSSITSVGSKSTRRSSLALTAVPVHSPTSPARSVVADSEPVISNDSPKRYAIVEPLVLPQSPSSPTACSSHTTVTNTEGRLEQLNALAANARRERKVLDLEISNSSLLAINRTLEREMRKQSAELRRFRRLTSAGRISIAPSKQSFSRRISSMNGTDVSRIDSDDDERGSLNIEPFSDEDDDNGTSSLLPGTPSSESQADHDARQRAKDERRIQLDLTKHQELLIDSQRMNQSLVRCLGWTEDLINEGRKALAYRVRVSDLEPGGRVLVSDERSKDIPQRRGLLSPVREGENNPWDFGISDGEIVTDGAVQSPQEAAGLRAYMDNLEEGWGI